MGYAEKAMRNSDGPFRESLAEGRGSDMDNLVLFSFIGIAMFAILDLLFVQKVNDDQSHGRKATREGGQWNQAAPFPTRHMRAPTGFCRWTIPR